MLPNTKPFIVWILDSVSICMDVIRWEILSYLIDYEKELIDNIDINWREKLVECFDWCLYGGYLDVIKWLWEISDGGIDIHVENEYTFRLVCQNGRLNVVKWLLNIDKKNIDVHAINDHAFRLSCGYNHLDVAKWLWKTSDGKIDICAENDIVFRWCCIHGHLDIVQWLWEVSNKSIDDGIINDIIHYITHDGIVDYLKKIKL